MDTTVIPNFGALDYKLEQSLTLMEKIVVELREIKDILKESNTILDAIQRNE